MINDTQSAQISQKQDGRNIYAIMKIMCLHGYHHNGFVATHALGHMITVCVCCLCTSCAQVHELPQRHCGDNREGTLLYLYDIYIGHIYVIYKTNQVQMEVLVATDKKFRNEK